MKPQGFLKNRPQKELIRKSGLYEHKIIFWFAYRKIFYVVQRKFPILKFQVQLLV